MDVPTFVFTAVGWLFAPAFAAVVGMYVERRKSDSEHRDDEAEATRKHDQAVDRALKATLRKDLVDS